MSEKCVTSVDIEGNTFEVPVSSLKWRPSAYGIVIKDNDLLLSPQFGDNSYDLPGGGIDLGENPTGAVAREVKEETGLEVTNPKILGCESSFFRFTHDGTHHDRHSIMLYYLCELVGGEISTDGFDEQERKYAKAAVWFPISKLDHIKVASSFDWRIYIKKLKV